MNKVRAKLDYLLKHNVWINKTFRFAASSLIKMLGLFVRVDEKAILFSAHGRKYNDSPKAIYEYLLTQPQFASYKLYWAIENNYKTQNLNHRKYNGIYHHLNLDF